MMPRSIKLLISVLSMVMVFSGSAKAESNLTALQTVGTWTNVVSFTINHSGNHIIMLMRDSQNQLTIKESFAKGSSWSEPEAVSSLNIINSPGIECGGLSLSYDEKTLYFHANKPDGRGGFDIYYVKLTGDGWGEPVEMSDINSEGDDMYPTVTPGAETIYFIRHQKLIDAKQERKEGNRMSIYYSDKDAKGQYSRPQITNIALNRGWVEDVFIGCDNETLLYSSRTDRKEPARLIYSKVLLASQWYNPEELIKVDDSYDYYQPQEANGKIYFIKSNNKKRERIGSIMSCKPERRFGVVNQVEEKGKVLASADKRPIEATINVYNPTTMQVLARYKSYSKTGDYDLVNDKREKYIVDVRSEGYSYASYMVDYKDKDKPVLPQTIELFDTIALSINVFDAEIFRPLDSKVIAVRSSDKAIFRSVEKGAGIYEFRLPLGSNYNIIATSKYFAENKFLFQLEGDIVFSHFIRELPLNPEKREISFRVVDAETDEPIHAAIHLINLSREEKINIPVEKSQVPATPIPMRVGDKYDVTVDGAKGYAFYSSSINMTTFKENEVKVNLLALKIGQAINLANIQFETASAELLPIAYPELDRLVKLMNENPSLRFELSAHTDNVGNAAYNMRLSEMRAVSVVNYLLENGISESRLVPKGYGLTQPKVPNDSDENRAINRRVEFTLLPEQE